MADWKDTLRWIRDRLEKPKTPVRHEVKDNAARRLAGSAAESSPPDERGTRGREVSAPVPNRVPGSISRPRGAEVRVPAWRPSEKVVLPEGPRGRVAGVSAVNVGLDFGTSTTKLCARKALGGIDSDVPVYPLVIGTPPAGARGLLCPSTVVIDDGKLYFGWEAERRQGHSESVLRHLKVCVVCEAERAGGCPFGSCSTLCAREEATDVAPLKGWFEVATDQGAARAPASFFATLFLAWVMAEAAKALPDGLRRDAERAMTFNLGVPLDQLDGESPVQAGYRRMSEAAWRLSKAVRNGLALETGLGWASAALAAPPAAASERLIELCPETIAGVISYVNSPRVEEGLYALVDIGAWTTDLTVFRLTDVALNREGVRQLTCYSAGTHRHGADQIDEELRDRLLELWNVAPEAVRWRLGDLTRVLREKREHGELRGAEIEVAGGERVVADDAVDQSLQKVREDIRLAVRTTLEQGYRKERREARWSGLPYLTLGGGAAEPILCEGLRETARFVGDVRSIPVSPNWRSHSLDQGGFTRMAVSYGLAFPSATWPKYLEPESVGPIDEPSVTRRSHEDIWSK